MSRSSNFSPVRILGIFFCSLFGITNAELINVASKGTATQSTEYQNGRFPARLAIDGSFSTFNHTNTTTPNNHLEIALDQEYEVPRMEITMRTDCCAGRMTGVIVRGFDDEGDSVYDQRISDPGIGGLVTLNLPAATIIRRVRLGFENGGKNPNSNTSMIHFSEVRIYAESEPLPVVNVFSASSNEIAVGQSALLSWETTGSDAVILYPGGMTMPANGSLEVSPEKSAVYSIEVSNSRGRDTSSLGIVVDGQTIPPRLNEFLASNEKNLARTDGSTPDWIEIWNPNPFPLDLTGYRLSDDPQNTARYIFPATSVPANGYLSVDAAAISLDEQPATGFALDRKANSRLIFSDPTDTPLQDLTYPRQLSDVSYGLEIDGTWRHFLAPTNAKKNAGTSTSGFVADTRFSVKRGFYQSPQSVEISTATEDAIIYFTTDGSDPHPENDRSSVYQNPVLIEGNLVLRAAAFRDDWQPTDIDTQTYLFVDQVGEQSSSPASFPQRWVPNLGGSRAPVASYSHFGMNSSVLNSLPISDSRGIDFDLDDALTSIPTISLVIDSEVLFDSEDGLHRNAQSRGRTWERPASMEILDPKTGQSTQVNCGLRMHGGWNRFPEMLKKSFRIYLRSEYGDPNLEFPLFPGSKIEKFDRLILRSGNGKAWPSPWRALSGAGNSLERVTYLRDQFVRDLQRESGNTSIPGTFAHLYINGHYWGLYNPVERPTEHFAAARFGGDDEDYDVIKWIRGTGHQVAAGNDDGWNELIQLIRGNINDPERYQQIGDLLDLTSFADYIIVNHFSGNTDWIDNNVYAMRNRVTDGPFRFFCWDSEESYLSVGTDISDRNVLDTCTEIHTRLRNNPEYRILFADRAYRHFFNDGALTLDRTQSLLDFHAATIDQAIVGESARWGSLHRPGNPYDRADWLTEVTNIRNRYLRSRNTLTLNQFRSDRLYPSVSPPQILPSRGGQVAAGTAVSLTSPRGKIYYTLDGSDPRATGGGISEKAIEFTDDLTITEGTNLRARILDGVTWSAIDDVIFSTGNRSLDLVVSEIMYHPEDGGTEFLEITNQGSVTHRIDDLKIIGGIRFEFADASASSIAPGQQIVLVRDTGQFSMVYPDTPVTGDYEGGLGNGGEAFSLVDSDGGVLLTIEYSDEAPWPAGTDGEGRSLVFVDGEIDEPNSWRPSITIGGNPGTSDSTPRPSDQSLLDYALASKVHISDRPTPELRIELNPGTDHALVSPQWSGDLKTWTSFGFVLKSQTHTANSTLEKSWQLPGEVDSSRLFFRVHVLEK